MRGGKRSNGDGFLLSNPQLLVVLSGGRTTAGQGQIFRGHCTAVLEDDCLVGERPHVLTWHRDFTRRADS
jgi:hypothetical protein